MANDHRLDVYVDATTYMALKQLAGDVDRSISQYVRHLIRKDMEKALAETSENGSGNTAGSEGEE